MSDAILLNIPGSVETARLAIRHPQPGDGELLYSAIAETLHDLRQFPASHPWALAEPSVQRSESFCRDAHAQFLSRDVLHFLMFLKPEMRCVGRISLFNIEWEVPKFEIGYWCRSSLQGQGLALEAMRAITNYAFSELGANRIEALPDELNMPSRRVCECAGYTLEGVRRNDKMESDGVLRNTCIYSATPGQYTTPKESRGD